MTAAPAQRLAWIDLLRGLAVVGMIETHVINSFLDARFDADHWLHELMSFDGLIAPLFLWIAGWMQGLAIQKSLASSRPVFSWPRLRRLALIGVIGYVLHVPWSYWMKGDFGPESWRIFLQVDILQCMAVSLSLLMFIGSLTSRRFIAVVAVATVAVVFVAPSALHWQTGALFIDDYFNRQNGSLFPLFPWFGFCAAGCVASYWSADISPTRATWLRWAGFVVAGLISIGAGYLFQPEHFLSAHPAFFIERLGWLLIFVAAIQWLSQWFAPRWLQLAGRESLLIYVAHLQLIHSLPVNGTPLNLWIGRTQSPRATAMIFFVILAVCLALAWANELRKQRAKRSSASA